MNVILKKLILFYGFISIFFIPGCEDEKATEDSFVSDEFNISRVDVKSRAGLNSYTAYTLGGIGTNDVTGIQTSMKVQRTASLKYKNYDT